MFTLSGKTGLEWFGREWGLVHTGKTGPVGNGVLFTLSGKTGLEWFGREWGLVHTVR